MAGNASEAPSSTTMGGHGPEPPHGARAPLPVPAATWRSEDEASRGRTHLGHRRHLGARLGRHVQPVGRGNPWKGRVEVRGRLM